MSENVLKIVFSIDENSIHEDLKAGAIEEWDSLGHLKFFLAIENRFKVKFSTEEITNAPSIKEIIKKIKDKIK